MHKNPLATPPIHFSLPMVFLLISCATLSPSSPPQNRGIFLTLPPAFIGLPSLEEGNARYEEGKWEEALAIYQRLILHTPTDAEEHRAGLFNAGLTYLQLDQTEKAKECFEELLRLDSRHPLSLRAFRNLLDLAEAEEKWEDARNLLERMKGFPVSPLSSFEERIHQGIIRAGLSPGEITPGELEGLILEFRSRLRRGETLSRSLYARLTYSLGGVYLYQARAITLDPDLPPPDLYQQMEMKAQNLLKAQDAYLQSIGALDPFWATASAFRIGLLYESFYNEILELRFPTALTLPEERKVYGEELRKLLEPLRKKAVMAFEELIRFSRRYSYASPWITRAEEHLRRLNEEESPEG